MILLMMQSRSGSSMVASIFHAHGYNCRHSGTLNQFDYCNYESVEVRKWLLNHKGKMRFQRGRFVDYVPGVGDVIGKNDCVKTGIEYWPIFKPLNMRVFTIRRNPESIIQSLKAKNPGGDVESIVPIRNEMLDQARDESGGIDIHTDLIVRGDYSGLKAAFGWHGLPFDERKARRCVQPSKWHH